MTTRKDLKNHIRKHAKNTGKRYAAARPDVLVRGGKQLCPACNSEIETRVVLSMEGVELDGDETDGQIADYYSALDSGEYGEWGVDVNEPYCPKCDSSHPKKSKDHQLIDHLARQANREWKLPCPFCGTEGGHFDDGDVCCPQCNDFRWLSKKERKEFYATQPQGKFFCRRCNKSYDDEQLEALKGFDCDTCHHSFNVTQARKPNIAKGERLCPECNKTYTPTQTNQRTCSEACDLALELSREALEDL
jgi:Zn finger protein HypA/HybF involved in hydrogenase expression